MRVFSIIGNCRGKAGLVQRLVGHFQSLGLTVSTIKRVSDDVDLDRPGKDTYLQRVAGAQEIVIANSFRSAILQEYRQPQSEPDVEELLARLKPVDLVLLEGFHLCVYPKLEVIDMSRDRRPHYRDDGSVIAITGTGTDALRDAWHPRPGYFDETDIAALALFILAHAAAAGTNCQESAA